VTERARSFGAVAAAYESFRLGYPDELVDEVLAYATRPIGAALEIGAGTGKATRAFAARGIAVTATDPDGEMLAELRRHVPASVTVLQGAFEDLPLEPSFDLVFAAASFHWTNPAGRWPRVAAMLNGQGVFASFGGQVHLADAALADAVRAVRSPYLGDDDVPAPDGTGIDSPMQWPGTELSESSLFTDVRQSVVERRLALTSAEYVAHLGTISAYLMLPQRTREEVLDRIFEVLPDRVDLVSDLTLHLARRA
jgi:SAM-dependent methyltransferase